MNSVVSAHEWKRFCLRLDDRCHLSHLMAQGGGQHRMAYVALDAVGAFLLWAKLKPDLETGDRWDAYMLQR